MGEWNKLSEDLKEYCQAQKDGAIPAEDRHIMLELLQVEDRLLTLRALVEIAGSLDSIAADLKALNKLQQRLGAKAESTMDRIRLVKERRRRK